MNARHKHEGSTLTLEEAVETLSNIAEMDLDKVMNLVNHPELIEESEPSLERIVNWLHPGDMEATVESVRESFRVVLHYLRNFYKKESGYVQRPETTEGIKSIMVLVGDAAKKVDRYTELFLHHKTKSVTEMKEYRRLQEFYLSRIAHKVDENTLGTWLVALTQRMMTATAPIKLEAKQAKLSNHVFVDLDAVKKDTEYELFFVRKEDGSRFFSPRLIRNIKLVCDFGESLIEVKMDDPLESLSLWKDHALHISGRQILKKIAPMVNTFYHSPGKAKSSEFSEALSKSLMALMMCCDAHNLMHDPAIKSCSNYFQDFHFYLRQALQTREYQKLIAYPPKKQDAEARELLKLAHAMCYAVYMHVHDDADMVSHIVKLVQEATQDTSAEHTEAAETSKLVWSHLASDFASMSKFIKRHANGPLLKMLDLLDEGAYNAFDSLLQNNGPRQLYDIYLDSRKLVNLHLPSPTYQEVINKALVTEEFKGFLRAMAGQRQEHHLMINVQDRTSWREHARCVALEDLQKVGDFAEHLTVVTLAKDTEFYNQEAPYNQDNHANIFIQHFIENLSDEACGFYFPPQIHKALFPDFVNGVINGIHRVFFSGKNVLSKEQRLNFIELFYMFLEMKIMELVKPSSFSFTCKDGVDAGATANAALYAFLRMLKREAYHARDFEQLKYLIYGVPVMARERVLNADRFDRLENAIRCFETVKQEFGSANFLKMINQVFGEFYKTPVLTSEVGWPEHEGAWLKAA